MLTETNYTGATNNFYYSSHPSHKPADPQSPTACEYVQYVAAISAQREEMFSPGCCSLRRNQPHCGAKYENSCWFCVLVLVGVLCYVCAHVSEGAVITHSGWKAPN